MAITARENNIGAWAFLVGVILAVIIGIGVSKFIPIPSIAKYSPQLYGVLVVLGLIIGIMLSGRESEKFMIAGTVLVIVSGFGKDAIRGTLIGVGVGDLVSAVFAALLILFVPATMIVALKRVFNLARV